MCSGKGVSAPRLLLEGRRQNDTSLPRPVLCECFRGRTASTKPNTRIVGDFPHGEYLASFSMGRGDFSLSSLRRRPVSQLLLGAADALGVRAAVPAGSGPAFQAPLVLCQPPLCWRAWVGCGGHRPTNRQGHLCRAPLLRCVSPRRAPRCYAAATARRRVQPAAEKHAKCISTAFAAASP